MQEKPKDLLVDTRWVDICGICADIEILKSMPLLYTREIGADSGTLCDAAQ